MYERILVAVDGSDTAHKALEVACSMAEQGSSKLILVCVTNKDIPDDIVNAAINEGIVRPSDYQDFASALVFPEVSAALTEAKRDTMLSRTAAVIAQEVIREEKGFAEDHNVKEVMTLVRGGEIPKAIVQAAREKEADLIVMGSENREGLDALMHPSVARAVRKDAHCPTMVLFQAR